MQSYNSLATYVQALPDWLIYLVVSVLITYTLCVAGIVLLRTGRSPLWALALLIPYAGVVLAWLLAYIRWPRLERPAEPAEDAG